jgi:oligoendopeptidase F
MKDQFKNRAEVPEQYRWNLSLMYSSQDAWEQDFKKIDAVVQRIDEFKGKLAENSTTLKQAYDAETDLNILIENLYSFASHRSDEDTRDAEALGVVGRIGSKAAEVGARLSWMEPELLETPVEKLKTLQTDPILKDYHRKIEELIRSKPHRRSAEVEEILSLASDPMGGAHNTFSLLENADMPMPRVKDSNGVEHEVNHGTYFSILESADREFRKNGFNAYVGTFAQYKNTYASTLETNVKNHVFNAKVRKHNSAIEASLFSDAIPLGVYNGLIDTVHAHLPLLHRLVRLRKKMLGVDELNMYDLFVPMVKPAQIEISYDEACQLVTEACAPLGQQYVNDLKKAFSERWIDVYYTTGKRSGAYSGGTYQSKPYILLNHQNNLGSAFTLAHELGHSLHSFYSRRQPYAKSHYPIFLAEIASTTNEMLLHFHLYERAETREMKLYLLDHLFTQFRSTLYRQVKFAEFERDIHAMVEQGQPLTCQTLCDHYGKMNAKYYGPDMAGNGSDENDPIRYEWSRIPHFYYNFYVYKYSTSFAASQYFARKIYDGDQATREKYLEFLASGCSMDPLDTMIRAGMDLRDSKPVEAAFKIFEDALDEFEKLI